MNEFIYFESGDQRIRVHRHAYGFTWFCGKPNYNDIGMPEYHGVDDSLEECLLNATEQLLEPGDPAWVVSRDQKTEV